MVPTSTNRAACSTETPSRSTVERPIAAASSSRSTRWSCSRLTSSTYRIPRWARASRPGSYSALPSEQRALEVQRAEHPVLGGADGQLDQPHRPGLGRRRPPANGPSGRERRRVARVAGEPVAGDHVDRRQHGGQRAHDRRLRRALLAAHQHAADLGRDRGEDQGQRHVVGADDGTEGELLWHVRLPLALPSDTTGRIDGARGRSSDFPAHPGVGRVTAAGLCRTLTGFPDSPVGSASRPTSGHLVPVGVTLAARPPSAPSGPRRRGRRRRTTVRPGLLGGCERDPLCQQVAGADRPADHVLGVGEERVQRRPRGCRSTAPRGAPRRDTVRRTTRLSTSGNGRSSHTSRSARSASRSRTESYCHSLTQRSPGAERVDVGLELRAA